MASSSSDKRHGDHGDHGKYVSLSMEFRCNLKCVHCMIEGLMDELEPTSDAIFERVLAE